MASPKEFTQFHSSLAQNDEAKIKKRFNSNNGRAESWDPRDSEYANSWPIQIAESIHHPLVRSFTKCGCVCFEIIHWSTFDGSHRIHRSNEHTCAAYALSSFSLTKIISWKKWFSPMNRRTQEMRPQRSSLVSISIQSKSATAYWISAFTKFFQSDEQKI